jgi:hypothetical protein
MRRRLLRASFMLVLLAVVAYGQDIYHTGTLVNGLAWNTWSHDSKEIFASGINYPSGSSISWSMSNI